MRYWLRLHIEYFSARGEGRFACLATAFLLSMWPLAAFFLTVPSGAPEATLALQHEEPFMSAAGAISRGEAPANATVEPPTSEGRVFIQWPGYLLHAGFIALFGPWGFPLAQALIAFASCPLWHALFRVTGTTTSLSRLLASLIPTGSIFWILDPLRDLASKAIAASGIGMTLLCLAFFAATAILICVTPRFRVLGAWVCAGLLAFVFLTEHAHFQILRFIRPTIPHLFLIPACTALLQHARRPDFYLFGISTVLITLGIQAGIYIGLAYGLLFGLVTLTAGIPSPKRYFITVAPVALLLGWNFFAPALDPNADQSVRMGMTHHERLTFHRPPAPKILFALAACFLAATCVYTKSRNRALLLIALLPVCYWASPALVTAAAKKFPQMWHYWQLTPGAVTLAVLASAGALSATLRKSGRVLTGARLGGGVVLASAVLLQVSTLAPLSDHLEMLERVDRIRESTWNTQLRGYRLVDRLTSKPTDDFAELVRFLQHQDAVASISAGTIDPFIAQYWRGFRGKLVLPFPQTSPHPTSELERRLAFFSWRSGMTGEDLRSLLGEPGHNPGHAFVLHYQFSGNSDHTFARGHRGKALNDQHIEHILRILENHDFSSYHTDLLIYNRHQWAPQHPPAQTSLIFENNSYLVYATE